MLQSMFLLLSLTLGLLLLSQKKQFEFRLEELHSMYLKKESEFQQLRQDCERLQSKNRQWELNFQELKLDLEREQALVLSLNQRLAKESGSVEERAKALAEGLR